jgi:hypothetical protein
MMFLGLVANFGLAKPEEVPAKKQRADSTKQQAKMQTWLGLGIESIPPVVSSQLPGIVPKGQGVLVASVAKDSPAEKAGLQPHDILLSLGDQKVSSAEQLVKLVRGDKPGQEVAVTFVRGGKRESAKVTLGKRESSNESDHSRVFRLRPDERLREMFEERESKNGGRAWESFDALKLTRLEGKRWRAEIEYRSEKGKKEHKTFEGTREEIRKDIRAEKDLPANEKGHLLRALNLHEPVFEFHLPPFDKLGPDFQEQP